MSWKKIQKNNNEVSYICNEGKLKGSTISIRKQDQFDENRYCSIVLRGDDDVIFKELYKPIRNACHTVKNIMDSPGLTTEDYTFLFHDGDKKSQLFFDCISQISKVCPFKPEDLNDICKNIGGVNAGEVRKNARILSQADRTQTSLFSKLPTELNIKIAGFSGITTDNDELISKSEKIASDHYDRPITKPKNNK